MIRITRKPYLTDRFSSYKIYANDLYLGKIKRNETKVFDVEKGNYSIYAKIDSWGSNKLDVVVGDSVIDLEVGTNLTDKEFWVPFSDFYYISNPDEYLWIKEKDKGEEFHAQPTPILTPALTQATQSDISVAVDGHTLSFDVQPQNVNSRIVVPMKAIFEAMGATINFDGDTLTVTATGDETVVVLTIGSTTPTVNGKVVQLDQPGIILNGRTLVPLEFVAEAFGGRVSWDGASRLVNITTKGK